VTAEICSSGDRRHILTFAVKNALCISFLHNLSLKNSNNIGRLSVERAAVITISNYGLDTNTYDADRVDFSLHDD
jgi:hypothetical protein